MKLRNLLAATALVAAIGANAQGVKYVINHNPEVDLSTLTTDKDGYYVLFDGKSLDGWRGYQKDYIPSKWNLKDGCLHFNGRGEGEGGDIIFAHQFKNFVFEVEWKISEGGNLFSASCMLSPSISLAPSARCLTTSVILMPSWVQYWAFARVHHSMT